MAEAVNPKAVTFDLTRALPQGFTLSGLAGPTNDGANDFWHPVGPTSRVNFFVDHPSFVQLEYQLYSAKSDVTGTVLLDGKLLGQSAFPQNKFIDNAQWGDFVQAGSHYFEVKYQCSALCDDLRQYWTKISTLDASALKAIQRVGLGVKQWAQYVPDSVVQIQGAGKLQFDGVNYFRRLTNDAAKLSWPSEARPLAFGYVVNGREPFRVTAQLGERVVSVKEGTPQKAVNQTVSLVGQFAPNLSTPTVSLKVECLKSHQPGCALLYFPEVTVFSTPAWLTSLPVAAGGALLLLAVAWWFLLSGPRRLG